MAVGPDDFRAALAQFATGVTVLTTVADDVVHGMTANAFTSVSLQPPLVAVCIDVEAVMHELLPRAGSFAINILSADQAALSEWFASPDRPIGVEAFADLEWQPGPATGCPLLGGCLGHVECRVGAVHAAGDHSIFVGEVLGTGVAPGAEPLVYHRGGYRAIADQNVPNRRSP